MVGAVVLLVAVGVGCGLRYINPDLPEDREWRELQRVRTRPRAVAQAVTKVPPTTRPRPAPARPRIVAVFDLEDRGAGLAAELLGRLGDVLSARLAASPRYQVVARDQLRQRVAQRQQPADRGCRQQACQIEIGREVAAEAALSTVVMRLGRRCQLIAVLYDLKRAVAVGGASVASGCEAEHVTAALGELAARLSRGASSP